MQGMMGWQDVRDEALRRIRARAWPPGERIPDEADLAAELGCARATVNRALRDLAETGLLERRRKGGTCVALNPVRKATFEIPVIRLAIETAGHRPGYRLLSDGLALPPDAIAADFAIGAPAPLRHVLALHLADDRPYCLEDRWLSPDSAPPSVSFATLSANEWLVQNIAFSGGTLAFRAAPADAEQARSLECAPGDPLLVLERMTQASGAPITRVNLYHAPGHRLETTL